MHAYIHQAHSQLLDRVCRPDLLLIVLCLRLPPHRYFEVINCQLLVPLACACDGLHTHTSNGNPAALSGPHAVQTANGVLEVSLGRACGRVCQAHQLQTADGEQGTRGSGRGCCWCACQRDLPAPFSPLLLRL